MFLVVVGFSKIMLTLHMLLVFQRSCRCFINVASVSNNLVALEEARRIFINRVGFSHVLALFNNIAGFQKTGRPFTNRMGLANIL